MKDVGAVVENGLGPCFNLDRILNDPTLAGEPGHPSHFATFPPLLHIGRFYTRQIQLERRPDSRYWRVRRRSDDAHPKCQYLTLFADMRQMEAQISPDAR